MRPENSYSDCSSTVELRFLLLPLPGFTMLPLGAFIDKLRFSADDADLSRQRYCEWKVLGLSPGMLSSSSGITIGVEQTPEDIDFGHYDYLVVFGCRSARDARLAVTDYGGVLQQAAAAGITLVSIDNASFLLAEAGLLNRTPVAVHWRHQQEFSEAFPALDMRSDQIFCIAEKRISCAGGGAAVDLAVELLARHLGRDRALKGLADMLVDEVRQPLHQLRSRDNQSTGSRHLDRALSLMRDRLAGPYQISALAQQIGIGRRQLDRLFQSHFDSSTAGYWLEMRLQHLRWRLLNSDHSLVRLGEEVGFADTSYLCKVFRKRFGKTPARFKADPARPT
ncbi:GlxA family transcriptional regulator [Marinobacterium jannaschii]|uniref:GlxA family transcriptional regulator n=1 Tax=Marinobacterium jannaschii TaxID=64970 RepID=UPI000686875B|nr:helix-turn-helix domain-containing protein [Marinobacterium jannaschii]